MRNRMILRDFSKSTPTNLYIKDALARMVIMAYSLIFVLIGSTFVAFAIKLCYPFVKQFLSLRLE